MGGNLAMMCRKIHNSSLLHEYCSRNKLRARMGSHIHLWRMENDAQYLKQTRRKCSVVNSGWCRLLFFVVSIVYASRHVCLHRFWVTISYKIHKKLMTDNLYRCFFCILTYKNDAGVHKLNKHFKWLLKKTMWICATWLWTLRLLRCYPAKWRRRLFMYLSMHLNIRPAHRGSRHNHAVIEACVEERMHILSFMFPGSLFGYFWKEKRNNIFYLI